MNQPQAGDNSPTFPHPGRRHRTGYPPREGAKLSIMDQTMQHSQDFYINGQWVAPLEGRPFRNRVRSPITGWCYTRV